MNTKIADIISGIVILFLSVFTYWKSARIETIGHTFLEADFWPKLISMGLFIAGSILLIQGLITKKGKMINVSNIKLVLVSIIILTCYIILIKYIGYFIVTPILIVLLGFMLGYRSWKIVAAGVFFAFMLYITFKITLQVPIP